MIDGLKFKCILVSTLLTVLPIFALAGGSDGGGGTDIEIEFAAFGKALLNYVIANPKSFGGKVKVKKLTQAVEKTKIVETDEDLRVDGEKKVAINYPRKRLIKVQGTRWTDIPPGAKRAAIVAHEYFGIMKIDNKNAYSLSTEILLNSELTKYFDSIDVAAGDDLAVGFRCDLIYKGKPPHNSDIDPLRVGLSVSNTDHFGYTPIRSRVIDRVGDKVLSFWLITKNANDVGLPGSLNALSGSNPKVMAKSKITGPSVRILIGWGPIGFFEFPQEIVFSKEIQVQGPIQDHMTLLNDDLEVHCKTESAYSY